MNFYDSMVHGLLVKIWEKAGLTKEDLKTMAEALMKDAACRALEDIRRVLDDDRLDDPNCFQRIEEIVKIYEEMGSNGGSRHDS